MASGIFSMINNGVVGETYHFTAGEIIPSLILFENICDLLRVDVEHVVEITSDRLRKIKRTI